MGSGKQVLLYLVNGRPGGLRTAEIANWTGHVIAAPRSELGDLLVRAEAKRTGVYLLLGDALDGDQPGLANLYIGESDEVSRRMRQHQDQKLWWDRVVIVTSQAHAQQLSKSQARYLEAELIRRAKETSRAVLDNGTEPTFARLSEAEMSNMDYFLEQLFVVLPTIGVDVFRGRATASPSTSTSAVLDNSGRGESPVFILKGANQGVEARARFVDGEFIVLAGSTAVAQFTERAEHSESTARAYASYRAMHGALVHSGVLAIVDAVARFTQDAPFGSPSTAGAMVLGRSCNGRISWATDAGVTFGEWEGGGLPRAAPTIVGPSHAV